MQQQQKQPITNQQMPGTAQNLTSTTPITPRNSCIYFKPNNPQRTTVSLAAAPPSSLGSISAATSGPAFLSVQG